MVTFMWQQVCYIRSLTCPLPLNKNISHMLEHFRRVVSNQYTVSEIPAASIQRLKTQLQTGLHYKPNFRWLPTLLSSRVSWVRARTSRSSHMTVRGSIPCLGDYFFLFSSHWLSGFFWEWFIFTTMKMYKYTFVSQNILNTKPCCVRFQMEHCCRISNLRRCYLPVLYGDIITIAHRSYVTTQSCPFDGTCFWYIS